MGHNQTEAHLPIDRDSRPIQLLSPGVNDTVHISATEGSSTNVALPADTEIVRVGSSGAVWLAFGGASVDASQGQSDSMFFAQGIEFFFLNSDSYTHVAARSVAGAGNQVVSVTKME